MRGSPKVTLKLIASVLFLLLLYNMFLNPISLVIVGSDEALAKMAEADSALKEAFKKVLIAEEAGANVTGLMSELNEAGGLLTKAERAYENGNISEALENADSSILITDAVENDAMTLEASAQVNGQRIFWQNLTLSAVGVSVFIITLLVVWKKFNRSRNKRLLSLKPEMP